MALEAYRDWLQGHVQGYRDTKALHPIPQEPPRWVAEIRPRVVDLPAGLSDTATHEAAHYLLGCVIGMPVANPRLIVGNPEVLGKVSIPPEPDDVDLDALPLATLQTMALRLAGFYLAGSVGECLAAGVLRAGNMVVIDSDAPDLANARRVLARAGIEGDRGLVWAAEYAQRCLAYAWRDVATLADEIRAAPPSLQ